MHRLIYQRPNEIRDPSRWRQSTLFNGNHWPEFVQMLTGWTLETSHIETGFFAFRRSHFKSKRQRQRNSQYQPHIWILSDYKYYELVTRQLKGAIATAKSYRIDTPGIRIPKSQRAIVNWCGLKSLRFWTYSNQFVDILFFCVRYRSLSFFSTYSFI